MPRVAFTAKTRKYLGSLDAVESVTQYRICYSKEFRDDCMRRYAEGGSPAQSGKTANLQTNATLANAAAKRKAKQQTRQQHNGKQKAPGRSFIRALPTSTQ